MTRLRAALPTFFLAIALLSMGTVSAPAHTDNTPDTVKLEIMTLLNSDTVEKQEKAVRLISHYAYTGQFDTSFYRIMVAPLHAFVAQGETESLRIMAVSALYSIGTKEAMRGLKAQMDSFESERLKTVAENALAEYKADRMAAKRAQIAE